MTFPLRIISVEPLAKVALPVPLVVLIVNFVVPPELLATLTLISFVPFFSTTSIVEIVTEGGGDGVGEGRHGAKPSGSQAVGEGLGGTVAVAVGDGGEGMVLQTWISASK